MNAPIHDDVAVLDPLRLPLHGRRLIEASAGTGKTWTIAALYLRMVLGHGIDKPLFPPDILVVTFTDAATQELRERIRLRLVEATRCFDGGDGDSFLLALRHDYPADQHAACARRLERAAQWMDEASIHTIHAWCQRMLTQHAFASGSAFAQTLETDNRDLVADCMRDWWRQRIYPLAAVPVQGLLDLWPTPDDLLAELQPLLAASEARLQVEGAALVAPQDWLAIVEQWAQWRRDADAQLAGVAQTWRDDAAALEDALMDGLRNNAFKANMIKPDDWPDEIAAMRAWSDGGAMPEKARRFTPVYLASATKKGHAAPQHRALDGLAAALAASESAPDLRHPTLADALAFVRKRFDQRQKELARMGFDDLLTRLDRALHDDQGDALAASIRSQFPLALVDEFQDTDPCQYRIFRSIWRDADASDNGLFLIGDPKQAIYAFRGADIHTYLRARRDALSPQFTLSTNFRSTKGLVDAVNRLFERGDRLAPDGAFAFADAGLPFHPVQAQGRAERLVVAGHDQPAMTLWQQPVEEPLAQGAYRDAMATACANGIATLLADPAAGFVDGDRFTPLRAADIAVLVRSRAESELVRAELSARGLRSVFLSDRDSVFSSDEARDLLLWLRACAEPGSDRALRAALATATLDLPLADIDRLGHDEAWREAMDRHFHDLHAIGNRRGVLAMLHELLHRFDLPSRLLGRNGGERSLTNLLHLAELLQQAAEAVHGDSALIRHLEQAIAQGDGNDDGRTLRLESDAGLIRVVTVHKAKGLEYPLVFLPFVCAFKLKPSPLQFHADGGRHIELSSGDSDAVKDATKAATKDALQEDLRLLYVALTRARHACWLGVAAVKHGSGKTSQLERSALGYLLGGGAPISAGELGGMLADFAGDGGNIVVSQPPDEAVAAPRIANNDTTLAAARTVVASAPPRWWIASYSALAYADAAATPRPSPETPHEDVIAETQARMADGDDIAADAVGIHRFPRGAEPGTFLHGLFEWAADAGFAQSAADPTGLRQQIARRCERRGWQSWIQPLGAWLPDFLRRPLALPDGGAVALADLRPGSYRAELEFWIEAHGVDTRRLDALVSTHTLDGAARLALLPERVNGLFKGFIDLVFAHGGRYYVLDYKSNRLGDDDAAYSLERMRESILAERYDLQYALYLLALHRQLKARLPGYDPHRHLGGAVYLYLRGVDADGHGVHVERPAVELIEQMDALFANGGVDGR